MHQLVPVGVARLGHVLAEGADKIAHVPRRKPTLGQRAAQFDRGGDIVGFAGQRGLDGGKAGELVGGRGRGMVGDIVGHPRERIEIDHRLSPPSSDEQGGDWEILVAATLAGRQIRGRIHRTTTMACARPFHMPPAPRHVAIADCRVKTPYASAMAGRAAPHHGARR